MMLIFAMGIALGLARRKAGSLPLCIILHALVNSIATVPTCALTR